MGTQSSEAISHSDYRRPRRTVALSCSVTVGMGEVLMEDRDLEGKEKEGRRKMVNRD